MLKVYLWNLNVLSKISKKLLITNFVCTILDGTSQIVNALLVGILVDIVIKDLNNPQLLVNSLELIVILIFCFYVFIGFIRLIINYAENLFRIKLSLIPQSILFNKINELGVEHTEDPEVQNKINRYKENIQLFYSQFTNFASLFANLAGIISGGFVLLSYIPIVIPLTILLLLPKILTNNCFLKQIWRTDKKFTPNNRMANEIFSKISDPNSFKEIYLSSSTNFFSDKFNNLKNNWINELMTIRNRWYKFIAIFRVLDAIIITIALLTSLDLIINQKITLGQLTFLLSTTVSFRGFLDTIVYTITNLSEGAQRLKDSKELFDHNPAISKGNINILETKLPPIIEFQNVSFRYPKSNKFVIRNLNLTLAAGEKVAIVGHNGAGKTTLIKLLTRIYTPTQGKILINGINLNEIDIESWYKSLGVLFQDYNTYGFLDVEENVYVGKIYNKINTTLINKSLMDSDALEFIQSYPKKLKTILSERYEKGIRPSTGQWQKIAIARFFYRNSPVLILDEPTASIDAVSEAAIFDNIYEFIKNKTVVIVSHRFSTVRKADRIIVIRNGEVIENGTHEELLDRNSEYAKAFRMQAKGYENLN